MSTPAETETDSTSEKNIRNKFYCEVVPEMQRPKECLAYDFLDATQELIDKMNDPIDFPEPPSFDLEENPSLENNLQPTPNIF